MERRVLEKDRVILFLCQETRLLHEQWQNCKHEVTITHWEKLNITNLRSKQV